MNKNINNLVIIVKQQSSIYLLSLVNRYKFIILTLHISNFSFVPYFLFSEGVQLMHRHVILS